MALASGLAGQIGFATETVPGTAVPVTKFVPIVSEGITHERERLESEGIIAGRRVLDSGQWNGGNHTTGGDIGLELYNVGLTTLFRCMFGKVVTTGASAPYSHVFTPGDLADDSLTIQVGRPGTKGTVHPFTYAGSKVESWEIACSQGEIATLGLTIVAMSETTGTALAVATMPAGIKPLKFNHASIKIDGTAADVKSFTLSGDNGLDTDRRFLGSQSIKTPLEADLRTYEGAFETEFEDLTQYNRFISGAEFPVEIKFTAGTDSVTFALNCRYDGETPVLSGKELLTQNLPIKCVGTTDALAITATVVNSDATA